MFKSIYKKNIKRTIFGTFGRFSAILLIICLGVGFFVGLKNTEPSIYKTANKYFNDSDFYDYKLISTYGFEEDEVSGLEGKNIDSAEGSYTFDFFYNYFQESQITVRAHSIGKDINKLKLKYGALPMQSNECVVSEEIFGKADIGRTIDVIEDKENDIKDNSKIKKGEESKDKKTFKYKSYKVVGLINSPEYISDGEIGITSLGDGKVDSYIYIPKSGFESEYYTEVYLKYKNPGYVFSKDYEETIADSEKAIKTKAEGLVAQRFDSIKHDAEDEIQKAEKDLQDGKNELLKNEKDTYNKLNDAKGLLDSKDIEIKNAEKEIAINRSSLNDNLKGLRNGLMQINQAIANAEQIGSGVPISEIEKMKAQRAQIEESIGSVEDGLIKIEAKNNELQSGKVELNKGYNDYYANFTKAESEFKKAREDIKQGEEELAEAKEELKELENPEIFLQTRDDNLGYASLKKNSRIVDDIAKIFPIFFFMIAALVCITTMTRMVEEERMQIGTFAALGYSNRKNISKYLIYSGIAAILGWGIGFGVGSKLFPEAIWSAYQMMFDFAPLEYNFNYLLAISSLLAALICSVGTTYIACRSQLKSMPAELLRPKAPRAGKRIILERLVSLWERLSFFHKVTARNILRYKKRIAMMVIGIGGCTALILVGFGINDSIAGIANHQYSNVDKYDITVMSSEKIDNEVENKIKESTNENIKHISTVEQIMVEVKNNKDSKDKKTANLVVTDNLDIKRSVSFKNKGNNVPLPGLGEGIISNNIAKILGVREGDYIVIEYNDTKYVKVKISGIYENYINNYVYINEQTYVDNFGEEFIPKVSYISLKDGANPHKISEQILSTPDIIGVVINEDIKKNVDEMMESLNYIISLVIACAALLAFIVLFNLGNINITERIREIATIKVLGFNSRESGAYVFRESLILTIIGIFVGLPAGVFVHGFVMQQINVDEVSFRQVIQPQSYLFTVLIVLAFTFIVDITLRRKLKKINMAEALKSVE